MLMPEFDRDPSMVDGDGSDAHVPAAPPSAASRAHKEDTSLFRWLLETILLVVLAFALAQGIKTFIVQPFVIPTGSMIPTIEIGDRVLADKLVYRFFREPQRGDIVVFDDPNGQHPQLIKRVIAVEGETVDVRDGLVYINDEPTAEPYTHGRSTDPGSVELPRTIPAGEVWLMGDNRPESGDSRFFGARPVETVRGRAFWTYWPLDRFGTLE
jgi:signal peptidase I